MLRTHYFVPALVLLGCRTEAPPSPHASASPVASVAPPPSASGVLTPPDQPPPAPKGPLNVLLITVDSLRADMPWTTYDKPIAPHLTALAKESVVYTNAYSVSSYTAKSVAALLSGAYPSSLYRSGAFFTGYTDANRFFTEDLAAAGMHTIGGHAHLYFGRAKNLNQGFAVWELVPGIAFDPQTDNNVTSDKTTSLAMRVLGKDALPAGKKWFAWFHYMDPHDVYVKHDESPDFGKNNRGRYDSEIFYTDIQIGKLLDFAKSQTWWGETAIIVSADHGEAFGEHGRYKHAFDVWDVLTRVPLFVHIPGVTPRVINERRSHIDIAPTVLELMGLKTLAKEYRGRSMVAEVTGTEKPDNREPIVLDLPEDSHNPPRRAVISGDYKLVVHGTGWKKELYDLAKDPGELTDLAATQADKLKEMVALYDKTWATIPQIEAFGGTKLKSGKLTNGPMKPPK